MNPTTQRRSKRHPSNRSLEATDSAIDLDSGRGPAPGLTRREFVKRFAGGLAVLWLVRPPPTEAAEGESGRAGRGRGGQRRPKELAAWIHIAADGTVTLFSGKAEIGQNVRTSLTAAVAEELRTPVATVQAMLADTSLVPWDAGTFGSRSTPEMIPQIRLAAATAREALLDLAAKRWNVDRASLTATDGKIRDSSGSRTIGYGELTQGEKLVVDVSDAAALTPATQWKILGTSVPKVGARKYVTGRVAYTADLTRPGMLHGRVLRPTALGATLASVDKTAAEAMPGVTVVHDGSFVGAVADSEHRAIQAIAALRAEWKAPPPMIAERDLFTHLRAKARNGPPPGPVGEIDERTLSQTYTVAYIAHAPLEPRSAIAEWNGDQLTVWTGTQRPFGVSAELAQAFRMPEQRIRVIVPDTGSGYGGKHTGEAAIEAARLAKAAGKPVKLVWTREEEFTWAYSRPAGVVEIRSSVNAGGRITDWAHHNFNSGPAAVRGVYDIANQTAEFHASQSPLRQGSYRALAATANHFARETHIDELARRRKEDPLDFRLKNLTDPRARAVLEAAAKRFGWGKSARGEGRGFGVALGYDKGGYIGTCVEIAIDRSNGRVQVLRVVESLDCGAVLNPDHLKNQVEGCIVQGLGGALFEAVRFENSRILNPRFSQYRVPRFSDAPAIEVVLVDRKDITSAGAGEVPIVGIAPAVGNAIFDATGIRLRSLPLVPNGLKV